MFGKRLLKLFGDVLRLLYAMKTICTKLHAITALGRVCASVHMKGRRFSCRAIILLVAVLALYHGGCATTPPRKGDKPAAALPSTTEAPSFDRVRFEHDTSPIGDVVRLFGREIGGGLVLMSGLEERSMPAISMRDIPYQEAVARFAASIDCVYLHTPYYFMILPSGYEVLQDIDLSGDLPEAHRVMAASVTLGAKTELYNAFAALSKSAGVTLVADNFIAETRTGEMFLPDAPFHVALEAIMQSARIAPGTFVVESTPEYIFIRAVQNTGPTERLLNEATLTSEQRALLSRTVSVVLPEEQAVSHAAFTAQPASLHNMLLPLSNQLGIEVVAQRRLADIPINPCVIQDVRLETALNLLLRQWPLPDFGFEIQENRILIRER